MVATNKWGEEWRAKKVNARLERANNRQVGIVRELGETGVVFLKDTIANGKAYSPDVSDGLSKTRNVCLPQKAASSMKQPRRNFHAWGPVSHGGKASMARSACKDSAVSDERRDCGAGEVMPLVSTSVARWRPGRGWTWNLSSSIDIVKSVSDL